MLDDQSMAGGNGLECSGADSSVAVAERNGLIRNSAWFVDVDRRQRKGRRSLRRLRSGKCG